MVWSFEAHVPRAHGLSGLTKAQVKGFVGGEANNGRCNMGNSFEVIELWAQVHTLERLGEKFIHLIESTAYPGQNV